MSTQLESVNFMSDIDKVLEAEVAQRHSFFQLKYFVIGKEPTHQARMWQCIRELKARREALVALELEIEEGRDNLELSEMQFDEHINTDDVVNRDKYAERRRHIMGRKLLRQVNAAKNNLAQLEDKKKWLLQEAQFFLESFKNLEKIEKMKPFDDLDAQKAYWGEKLANKINLKMLMQNPVDTELIETVIALPDDIPVKQTMVKRLNSIQNQMLLLKEEYKKKLGAA
jgi:hypothetical protein